MRSTFTTSLELSLPGHSGAPSEADVTVHYCHTPATGDGFHEQHWPEDVEILQVVHERSHTDIYGVLPIEMVDELAAKALELVHEGEPA